MQISPQSSIIDDNGSIGFACTVSGYPVPNITWIHVRPDGQNETVTSDVQTAVTPSTRTSTLTLTDARALAAGTYLCRASNVYETREDRAELTVLCKFSFTGICKVSLTVSCKF